MKKSKFTEKDLRRLARKVLQGKATREEKQFLDEYYDLFDHPPNEPGALSETEKEELGNEIRVGLPPTGRQISRMPFFAFQSVAAAILLIMFAAISIDKYLSVKPVAAKQVAKVLPAVDSSMISHGGNKAVLTLANGQKINLTNQQTGMLAEQAGVKVTKTGEGKLNYTATSNSKSNAANDYNILQTPRGGMYQLTLPDGTQVWLNSASTLKYPVAFTGSERRVELDGEAYFEVAHSKTKPFRVAGRDQLIDVLGTHFNVNAYADEPGSVTTLLEGSVYIRNLTSNAITTLVPGQQSRVTAGKTRITKVDADNAIAWKNGLFQFDNDDIHVIMRKLSRWYDVDVEYQEELNNVRFGGTVSRYADIRDILRKLELTNTIHFKITAGKIIVMK